jgi:hypothetical protein
MVRNRKLEMSMLLFCTFSLFTPLKELLWKHFSIWTKRDF